MSDPIFVFGSNLKGAHGKGAALHAKEKCGARYGVGSGPTGTAYAIPTKDRELKTLTLNRIAHYVSQFIAYARANPDLTFEVTPIGTGLAGYKHTDIAPLFLMAPGNCQLPAAWLGMLGRKSPVDES
jgi:hypothetical protein